MDDQMIRKLYRDMLQEEGSIDKISRDTMKEIEELLLDIAKEKECQGYKKCWDEFLLAVCAAEENGFVKGFRHAFRLFMECAEK